MRAAILAAGEGSRLRSHFNGPKPLFPILGLPLIVRNILQLREAGIHEFVIITGCYDRELRDVLGDGSQWNVQITYVYNARWQLGNGVSAQAYQHVYQPGEKFILLMADHLFEPGAFRSFVAQAEQLEEGSILLAADRKLHKVHDVDESTKIAAENRLASQLGKNLSDFNAVDCGLFLCTGAILDALSQAMEEGRYGLTDAVNILAGRGKVKLHFVEQAWVDVDDPQSIPHAEKMLLGALVPAKDGFVSRHFNRKISLRITQRIAASKMTPNQISSFSFLVSLFAALSFGMGYPWAGGLFAQFSSILDGVDGEIARLKFQQSLSGELFDSILDRYADYFIIMGMTYWWFVHSDQPAVALLVGMLALSGQPMSMLLKEKYKTMTGKTYIPDEEDGWFRYIPANRDGRLFLILLGGMLNLIPATLIVLAVLTHGQTLGRLITLYRKLSD